MGRLLNDEPMAVALYGLFGRVALRDGRFRQSVRNFLTSTGELTIL